MKKILILLGVLAFTAVSYGQTVVSTGTATDSDSIAWAGGSWSVQFRPNPQYPSISQYYINGVSLQSLYPSLLQQSGNLDNTGTFSVTTVNNSSITPTGSEWDFKICPNAVTACGQFSIPTIANSNISTVINANITAPRFHPVSGAFGYSDIEAQVQLVPGSTYWNVTTGNQKCYTGSAWLDCTGGSSGPYVSKTQVTTQTMAGPLDAPIIDRGGQVYNVLAYGAKCDGTTDDAASFRATFTAMGTIPYGVFYVPNTGHVCVIGSTVEMNLGFPGAPGTSSPTNGAFTLHMDGAIRPTAGIGAAFYIHSGWSPVINFKVDGGGQWGDYALKLSAINNFQISAQGKDYAGTVFYAFGTGGATGIQLGHVGSIRCLKSGQCFNISNEVGFGKIDDVEDATPTHASQITSACDVTIGHMESDSTSDVTSGALAITNACSIHLGKIAIGTGITPAQIISVTNSTGVTADYIDLAGTTPTTGNGLLVSAGSDLSVRAMQVGPYLTGVLNQGSFFQCDDFYALSNTIHYKQTAQPAGSTVATGIIKARSTLAYSNSYSIDSSLTGGSLTLSGENSGGDQYAYSTTSVLNNSTAVLLFIRGLWDHSNNAALVGNVGGVTGAIANTIIDTSSMLDVGFYNTTSFALVVGPYTAYSPNLVINTSLKLATGTAMTANHGTGTSLQHSDGTGTTNYVATYAADGSTTDGKLTSLSYHFKATGTPSIVCGTGAGTSPAVCSITGNDEAGLINVTTGSAPTANAVIATITLANACPTTVYSVIRSANANAAQLSGNTHEFPDTFTAGSWTVTSNNTGLAATTAYAWAYIAKCN